MNARTRQKVVFVALPLAMIWGAYNLFWTEQETLPTQSEITAQAVPVTQATATVPGGPDLERLEGAGWGADPFRTVIKRSGKPADKRKEELKLILSGIVFNEKSPMAVINKTMVRPGDAVGGARVVSIGRKTVLMEKNGKKFLLKVTNG